MNIKIAYCFRTNLKRRTGMAAARFVVDIDQEDWEDDVRDEFEVIRPEFDGDAMRIELGDVGAVPRLLK